MSGILIVTGASRGIGAACARLGAREGYDVCVNYLAARERADRALRPDRRVPEEHGPAERLLAQSVLAERVGERIFPEI